MFGMIKLLLILISSPLVTEKSVFLLQTSMAESPGNTWGSLYQAVPEPVFYVIETAQLELCLTTASLDDSPTDLEDEFMCPIKLRKGGHLYRHSLFLCSYAISPPSILMIFKSYLSVCLCTFPKPPKVPGSWNVGSRRNLGQLKTWRSPILPI